MVYQEAMNTHAVLWAAYTFVLAGASFEWLESPFLQLKREKFTYISSGSPVLT